MKKEMVASLHCVGKAGGLLGMFVRHVCWADEGNLLSIGRFITMNY